MPKFFLLNISKSCLKIENLLFDSSLLFYFIAYFFYYQNVAFDASIRMLATAYFLLCCLNLLRVKKLYFSWCAFWYLLFIVYSSVSSIWAVEPSFSLTILPTLIRILLVGFFIQVRVEDDRDVERILSLYVIATSFMCVGIFLKMLDAYPWHLIFVVRFGNEFGYNPNITALMCVFSIMICLQKILKLNFRYIIPMFFLLFIISLCGSKKGVMGLVLGPVLLSLFREQGLKKIKTIILAFVIVFIVINLINNVPFLYEATGSRIMAFFDVLAGDNEADYSTFSRMQLITQAFDIWNENPFFGVGLNNFSVVQTVEYGLYAHCNYAEILADLGIIGFLLYYIFPFFILLSKQYLKKNSLKAFVLLLIFFDSSVVSYQLIQLQVFYWLLASETVEKSSGVRLYVS